MRTPVGVWKGRLYLANDAKINYQRAITFEGLRIDYIFIYKECFVTTTIQIDFQMTNYYYKLAIDAWSECLGSCNWTTKGSAKNEMIYYNTSHLCFSPVYLYAMFTR